MYRYAYVTDLAAFFRMIFRYRAVPFLAEVTAIMNWMYSDTSLEMGEWLKLWSIHAEVFELKCWREYSKVHVRCLTCVACNFVCCREFFAFFFKWLIFRRQRLTPRKRVFNPANVSCASSIVSEEVLESLMFVTNC